MVYWQKKYTPQISVINNLTCRLQDKRGEYITMRNKSNNNKNSKIYEVNLEQGRPTVDTAIKYLEHALSRAKAYGYPAIKLIHGYGSSGSGGKIKTAVHRELNRYKNAGKIREFAAGENFSPFDSATQRIITICYDITRDSDYFKTNQGITIVLI